MKSLRVRFVYYDIGASTRYRVQHHAEQVRLAGGTANEIQIGDRAAHAVQAGEIVYIQRLPLSQRTLPILRAARRAGAPVVFDSDDLVWDVRERQYNYLDAHYRRREIVTMLLRAFRTRLLMHAAQALVFSTPYLARLAAHTFRKPIYVSPNVLSQAMLDDASAAYAQRRRADGSVIIGYFSGTPRAHDEDLASIGSALAATLQRFPQVRLRLFGGVQVPNPLTDACFAARVEQRAVVDWHALPTQIADTDINIAPLVNNPQRRAKSGIKYLEAAIVGVSTVAADLEPYQMVIENGVTGWLASTHDDWVARLADLVKSPERRRTMAEAARTHAFAAYTPAANAASFAALLREVAR